jgi:hypothetical protein
MVGCVITMSAGFLAQRRENMVNQNDLEYLLDMVQRNEITADRANIEMVRMERVRIVNARIPKDVRAALNGAVKNGELCHKKKDGRKPEVYYHPNFEYLANEERNKIAMDTVEALLKTLAPCCGRAVFEVISAGGKAK